MDLRRRLQGLAWRFDVLSLHAEPQPDEGPVWQRPGDIHVGDPMLAAAHLEGPGPGRVADTEPADDRPIPWIPALATSGYTMLRSLFDDWWRIWQRKCTGPSIEKELKGIKSGHAHATPSAAVLTWADTWLEELPEGPISPATANTWLLALAAQRAASIAHVPRAAARRPGTMRRPLAR